MSIKTLLFAVGALALAACEHPTAPVSADAKKVEAPKADAPNLEASLVTGDIYAVKKWSNYDGAPDKIVTFSCAPGHVAVSGGFSIYPSTAPVTVKTLAPFTNLGAYYGAFPPTGWEVRATSSSTAPWALGLYAVCT